MSMHEHQVLELAVATNDVASAEALAQRLNGTLYRDHRAPADHLPFACLVTASTDDPKPFTDIADVGLYLTYRRLVKPGQAEAIAMFPMVRHPDLTHAQSDAHWRDVHAPLALEHHSAMTHYTQLSVVATLSGPELDGFALCGFANENDLRTRFYNNDDSVRAIEQDVRQFANPSRSWRRLIVSETRHHAGA